MSFAWPHLLILLVLPVLLLAWELRRHRQQAAITPPKILQAEARRGQLRLQPAGRKPDRRVRGLLCLGLALAVVALARPQWGRLEEPVFEQSREILLALDLSRSMLAPDVKPARLDRAKLLISALLDKLAGERVGLAIFSGSAFLQSPLSADYEILREFLPALGPDYLPEGGTNYRALLETVLQSFGSSGAADRFLIVLSDGEATDDNWQPLVADLQKKNIRVISLGIGTAAGAMIPDGDGGFVKDDRGAVVLSRLENQTLQQLARETGGVYQDATAWVDLATVLEQTVEAGRAGEFVEKRTVRLAERFQWALAPAVLCLLLSFWHEFPVRPRPRELKLSPGTSALLLFGLLLTGLTTTSARAAETATSATPAPELSPLGKIVSRLSGKPAPSGRDWAELARETVSWGQQLQTAKQPVPAGPVQDALAAVNAGEQLDPATADWSQLRRELEALLQPTEEPPPEEQPQEPPPQDQEQQQENQELSPQDQSQPSPSGENPDQSPPQQNEPQPSDQNSGEPSPEQKGSPKNQQAFGDMQDKAPPPQPGEMQQVGGEPQQEKNDPAALDPALAMPLQKLEQIRDRDSPAQLFQLLEGNPASDQPSSGKKW